MAPAVFTDEYIRRMCPENDPIPLKRMSVLDPTTEPAYLARGFTGIRYVEPPARPPRNVETLARTMASMRMGTSDYGDDVLRRQRDVIQGFVNGGNPPPPPPPPAAPPAVVSDDDTDDELPNVPTHAPGQSKPTAPGNQSIPSLGALSGGKYTGPSGGGGPAVAGKRKNEQDTGQSKKGKNEPIGPVTGKRKNERGNVQYKRQDTTNRVSVQQRSEFARGSQGGGGRAEQSSNLTLAQRRRKKDDEEWHSHNKKRR